MDHLSIYVFQKRFAAYALCNSYLLSSSLPLSLKRQLMSSSTNSARNKTCLLPPHTHKQTHTVSRIISEECKSQRKGWHVKKHYLLSKTHPFHSRTLSSYEHLKKMCLISIPLWRGNVGGGLACSSRPPS